MDKKLISFKKNSGKTTKEISLESGIPIGTLNKLFSEQTKNPKLDTVRSVVHTLGYTLDDLFYPSASQDGESFYNKGEEVLLNYYRELNQEGQEKLLSYADDLVSTGKYKKAYSNRLDTKEA